MTTKTQARSALIERSDALTQRLMDVLRQVRVLHRAAEAEPGSTLEWCNECGHAWPCWTFRVASSCTNETEDTP